MGFFESFNLWLNALLATYIGDNTARIAAALEPAVVTLGVIYVMVWGYLQLTGQIEEPFITGLKRIATLAFVLLVSLRLWLYNTVIVDTFLRAPGQLAAAVIGAYDPVRILDQILTSGTDSAEALIRKGGILHGNFSYYLGGFIVYAVVGLTAIYAMFLLTLSQIALSVLLALGPFFFGMLLFDSTRRFFEAWLAQLSNYAFITVLTVLVAALMLHVLAVATAQALALGDGIEIAHGVRVCLAAGLTLLVLRQVMPMASGLASGLSLSTFGLTSASIGWALGSARRKAGDFVRGASDSVTDQGTTRWDSLSRKAGYYSARGVAALGKRARRALRPNEFRANS